MFVLFIYLYIIFVLNYAFCYLFVKIFICLFVFVFYFCYQLFFCFHFCFVYVNKWMGWVEEKGDWEELLKISLLENYFQGGGGCGGEGMDGSVMVVIEEYIGNGRIGVGMGVAIDLDVCQCTNSYLICNLSSRVTC